MRQHNPSSSTVQRHARTLICRCRNYVDKRDRLFFILFYLRFLFFGSLNRTRKEVCRAYHSTLGINPSFSSYLRDVYPRKSRIYIVITRIYARAAFRQLDVAEIWIGNFWNGYIFLRKTILSKQRCMYISSAIF